MIILRTDSRGSELRGSLWLFFDETSSSNRQKRILKFWHGPNQKELLPLFGEKKSPGAPGLSFGLLVKWAVKLLGARGAELVGEAFPDQSLGDFDIRGGNHWRQSPTPAALAILKSLAEGREERGLDLPAAHRSLFLFAARTRRIVLDGIELYWDERHDEWHFAQGEIPLGTAVKFAARILRDEKTAKEWPAYFVPWLADNDELRRARESKAGPDAAQRIPLAAASASLIALSPAAGGTQPLDLASLNATSSIGLARVAAGFQLVAIEDETEGATEILYLGDLANTPRFADWAELVDTVADLLADLPPEVVQAACGDMPLCPQQLKSWLYPAGAKRHVSVKEEIRVRNSKQYGDGRESSAIRDALAAAPKTVKLWQHGNNSVSLRADTAGQIVIVGTNGVNPVFSGDDLLRLLALLLSDKATDAVRPLQFAAWLLPWHNKRFGAALLDRPDQADVEASVATPAPKESAVAPRREPVLLLWKLPAELSAPPLVRTAKHADPDTVFGDLNSPTDNLFRQCLSKVLSDLHTDLSRR